METPISAPHKGNHVMSPDSDKNACLVCVLHNNTEVAVDDVIALRHSDVTYRDVIVT